jgi:RNA polymerase sigma factor (sigma-70 family)
VETQSVVLRRAKAGDADEFAAVYAPLVLAMVRASGVDRSNDEDVMQQVLLEVLRKLPTFEYDRTKGSFRGFLKKMVRERALDVKRRRRPVGEVDETIAEPSDAIAEWCEDQWRQAHLEAALDRVRKEVQPTTFQAFDLLVIQELPVEQVAAMLGQTPNHVCQSKLRVARRLREHLQEMLDEA